jgi:hypothetical protein
VDPAVDEEQGQIRGGAAGGCRPLACADNGVRLQAPPMPSAPARPRNCLRENPLAVSL